MPTTITATDLVSRALRLIGYLGATETPVAADLDAGFLTLNEMVDAWATERLMMPFVLRTTKTLAANTASYTIGDGGSIDIIRPVSIQDARLIIDTAATTPYERPIAVYDDRQWANVRQKTQTASLSEGIYYDRSWAAGLGIVYPWPIPDVGTTQLVLYTPQAIIEFAALTTAYSFTPGYRKALRYNLALELAPEFDLPVPPTVARIATEMKAHIKRLTDRPAPEAAMPPEWSGGRSYNIYTD